MSADTYRAALAALEEQREQCATAIQALQALVGNDRERDIPRQALPSSQPARAVEKPAPTRRAPDAAPPLVGADVSARALAALQQLGPVGTTKLAERLSLTPLKARGVLQQLADAGRVYSTGTRRSQRWYLGKPSPAKEEL